MKFCLLLVGSCFFASLAGAADFQWSASGANGTAWTQPLNWTQINGTGDLVGYPDGPEDKALIDSIGSTQPGLSTPFTVNLLTLGNEFGQRQLTLNGTTGLVVTTCNLDQGEVLGGGTLTIAAAGNLIADQKGPNPNKVSAVLVNNGTVKAMSGDFNVGANYTQNAGATMLAGGSISGMLNINAGMLQGAGNVTGDVTLGGTLAPGNSPGGMTIDGNLTQTANGNLAIEIGGTGAGQFDTLTVTGNATFNGKVTVTLLNGFSPGEDDTFEVGSFLNRTGSFSGIEGSGGFGAAFINNKVVLGRAAKITSTLSATGSVGSFFSYTVQGVGKAPVTLTATGIPPGLSFSGNVISGIASQPGFYMVGLSATNAFGSQQQTLTILIKSNSPSGDSDGDGFSDELEDALGTSSGNPASTPFGGKAAGVPQVLSVKRLGIRLNFGRDNMDSLTMQGTLPLPAGFSAGGKEAVINIGGVIRRFTLNAKGASPRGDDTFKLLYRGSAAQDAKFLATVKKGDFENALADERLANADVRKEQRTVSAAVLLNDTQFTASVTQEYTAKAGKSGRTK